MNYRKPILCSIAIGLSISAFAQDKNHSIKGEISDAQTKEVLVGATLYLNNNNKTSTQLDGSFIFRNLPAGSYTLRYNSIGYAPKDTIITINSNTILSLQLNNNSSVLSEVEVTRSVNKESDSYARKLEKIAPGVINTVSANAIMQSPDMTIANVLQRMSGVSLERSSSGEGRHAIIRGMDQRYNYTLVNGIKIPSPDNKNRYVPLDIFPSDLVERIEVHKTLTPDMEGDAVGGVVNLVMKNAPANGLYLKASASAGLSQNLLDNGYNRFPVTAINKKSPYQLHGPDYNATADDFTRENYNYSHQSAPVNSFATFAIGNRYIDKKLGVMLGLSYQNVFNGYKSFYSPAEPLSTDGTFLVKHANIRDYSTQQKRTAASLKMDYALNAKNKISLYTLYANLTEAQTRITQDTIITPPRTNFGNGQVWYFGRSRYQDQKVLNTTLQGEHQLSNALLMDWSAVYSKANNKLPDFGEYEHDGGINPDGTPLLDIIQNFRREWWRNSDRDFAGYLNIQYSSQINELPFSIKAGGLIRDKKRDNYYDSYTLRPTDVDGKQQIWSGIENFQWYVSTPKGSPASANNYNANEKIIAGYTMAKISLNKLEAIAGVRIEKTEQGYVTQLPETIEGKTASYNYTSILPSLNLKYLLTDISNIRLVYFSAVNRPGFFEPVPYSMQGDDFTEHGNYNVKHATAQNIDTRYELFLPKNAQLLVGAFYKKIKDPIEYGFAFTGNQASVAYQPGNYGDASNYGFELVAEKYFGPIGIRANYTYTNSSITTSKRQPYKDEDTQAQIRILDEKRPLQGQSAHLANAALLYKNSETGTDVQFNWQFTGPRIALVSPYYGMDYWMKGMHTFDASAEQEITKNIFLFAKLQNLFGSKYQVYINKQPDNINIMPFQNVASGQTLMQRNEMGRMYLLGLRFDLNK